MSNGTQNAPLAVGGGNATAAGVRFQAEVGALFAARMLAETAIDPRLGLGDAHVRSIRFETSAPLDDILVETTVGGFIAVQAKTQLSLTSTLDSQFGSVVDQIARYWVVASQGTGGEDWARQPDPVRDRLLVAVGPGASAPVRNLGAALDPTTPGTVLTAAQLNARATFIDLLNQAWAAVGHIPIPGEAETLLAVLRVITFDVDGPDRQLAIEQLRGIVSDRTQAEAAYASIVEGCLNRMRARGGLDAQRLRADIASTGIRLSASPRYAASVAALKNYSRDVEEQLTSYEKFEARSDEPIHLDRECVPNVLQAVENGSLLLIGEPGTGKSGVLNALARKLRERGDAVVELAVDKLPVSSIEGLSQELRLDYPILEVLGNWPGSEPAYLIIDALDATRGGNSDAVFRALIEGAIRLSGGRWRVVASIRTFDLRLGRQFRQLFPGQPPIPGLADRHFPTVRHVVVPAWTDTEFAEILSRSEPLRRALDVGGSRLVDLAHIPFNTRLLGDLLARGTQPDTFAGVTSQTRLLAYYWQERVDAHGSGAELCLQAIVDRMVSDRSLRAPIDVITPAAASSLDALEHEGVLVRVQNQRHLAFRHHILFDYAASRLRLDATDAQMLRTTLAGDAGTALALAPALGFSLNASWEASMTDRGDFWHLAADLASDTDVDPVAKSVVARMGAELPTDANDVLGLNAMLEIQGQRARSHDLVRQVLGALSVRVDDGTTIIPSPWLALASSLARLVAQGAGELASPLRVLLHILIEKKELGLTASPELGASARALLAYALAAAQAGVRIVPTAISFVAATYATEPTQSRGLLRQIITPERFADHAANDVPWIAQEVAKIEANDPEFAAEIYGVVFSNTVDDHSTTNIGNSQILPLRSTAEQDYSMARYALCEHFPIFVERHPHQAVAALIAAINGHIRQERPNEEDRMPVLIHIGTQTVTLIPDLSYVWAWNISDTHASDATTLLQAVVERLNSAPPKAAWSLAQEVLQRAEFGIVWSRLLHAAATRPDVLGDLLWPIASAPIFLTSRDTIKDAIDAAAAIYPLRSKEEKEAFETQVLSITFDDREDPLAARTSFLRRLLSKIGHEHVATDVARTWLTSNPLAREPLSNERLFQVTIESITDPRNRVEEAGLDPHNSVVASLFAEVARIEEEYGLDAEKPVAQRPAELLYAVEHLANLIVSSQIEEPYAIANASDPIIKACHALVANGGHALDDIPDGVKRVTALVLMLAQQAYPVTQEDTETSFEASPSWGAPAPRVDAADLVYDVLGLDLSLSAQLLPIIEQLIGDMHPAVRFMAVQHLPALWMEHRAEMWRLVNVVADHETNHMVLKVFANHVLGRLNFAAEQIEPIVLRMWGRIEELPSESPKSRSLGAIASLLTVLWIWRGRQASGNHLSALILAPIANRELLRDIGFTARPGIIAGYEDDGNAELRRRAQSLVGEILSQTAAGLEAYFQTPPDARNEDEAKVHVELLDHSFNQFFFAASPTQRRNSERDGIVSLSARAEFLADVEPLLRRVGDVASPRTIYHLVKLLDHLMPSAPSQAFDLVAHAMLKAGRQWGYQSDFLGAELFANFIGRCLADHREIFEDKDRRRRLVECLEIFVDENWPKARRLIYQLPELFR